LPWWLPDSWRSTPLAEFDRLLFFELKADAQGMIGERHGWPEQWDELRQAAAKAATPLDLALTLLDAGTFDSLFGNAAAQQTLLAHTLALAAGPGVHGIQLDVEVYSEIRPATLKNYRAFTTRLAAGLHQLTPPRSLSVFFSMGADVPLYDAITLAQVEHVVLQGYDSHWLEAPTAGPVAPLTGPEAVTWEKAAAQGLALGVPRERLLLSFPLYGYEWPVNRRAAGSTTSGKGVTATFATLPAALLPDVQISVQDRVRQYGAQHDPVSGSSYYQFKRRDGRWIEGWFEDWWTLGRKADYLTKEQLGGIAFFPLGYDNGELVDYFLKRRGARTPVPSTIPQPKPSP
jgi:spore germination protein YaaH